MIKLSLEHINAKSPYEVREKGGGYEFRTEEAYSIVYVSSKRIRLEAVTLTNLQSPR